MIAGLCRGARNAAIFAIAAVAGCAAIGRALPLPEVPQVKEKLDWFRAHRGDYTALFLGTSRVRRHIIPSLFDRLAAEHGMEMRSFNLGVDSLAAPEDGYVLDHALAAAPPRLRYVFVELSYFRANFAGQGADTIRSAYWHDWMRTRAVLRQLIDADLRHIKPLKKRKKDKWRTWMAELGEWTGIVLEHGRLLVQRTTNLGRGAALLRHITGRRPTTDPLVPLGPGRDGFIPSAAETVVRGAAATAYEAQIAALKSGESRKRTLDRVPQENLERMLARIRAQGAQPILFIAPSHAGLTLYPRRAVAPLFDFSDPLKWPELFETRYRADAGHLNTAGAEVFTRVLADKFFALEESTTRRE